MGFEEQIRESCSNLWVSLCEEKESECEESIASNEEGLTDGF